MNIDWSPLLSELALWRGEGLRLPIWWRDDDAVDDTPELRKLLDLGDKLAIPVHLAIIPKDATPALRDLCEAHPTPVPMVHGWGHVNHASEGAKKSEFGQPRAGTEAETAQALNHMQTLFGARLFPMFVPPWNRIDASVVEPLNAQGYTALSTFTPRPASKIAGLTQINTHIDPINWKVGGGLVSPERVIAVIVQTLQDRRLGRTDRTEPMGFLTHHLVHDAAIWAFTERCLSVLLEGGAEPCNLSTIKDLS